MNPKILIVEDDASQQLIISKALSANYQLSLVESFAKAMELIETVKDFELFILDIMLPDGDGFELCAQVRMQEPYDQTPVIFLSSKDEVKSKVLGFSLGADDYIVKPCDPMELRARVESKIKKNQVKNKSLRNLTEGNLFFDLDRQNVYEKGEGGANNDKIDLTPLEFKLLYYLAKNKDIVFSRNQILEEVWGDQTHVLDRSVDTYVASLRKKLGPNSHYIKSVHGVGYKFTTDAKRKR